MRKIRPEHLPVIATRYRAGESTYDLAEAFGVSQPLIGQALREAGVQARSASDARRQYPLDETAFDEPLGPTARYWVGMLLTDGWVSAGKQPVISLGLAAADVGHLRKFAAFLRTTIPFRRKPPKLNSNGSVSQPMYRLDVTSARLRSRLAKLGVTPRKSMTATAPAELAFDPDFWRGCIDGDGSVNWRYRRGCVPAAVVRLCGSVPLTKQFVAYVRSLSPGYRGAVRDGHGVPAVRVNSSHALAVLRHCYTNPVVALDRKSKTAAEILTSYRPVARS